MQLLAVRNGSHGDEADSAGRQELAGFAGRHRPNVEVELVGTVTGGGAARLAVHRVHLAVLEAAGDVSDGLRSEIRWGDLVHLREIDQLLEPTDRIGRVPRIAGVVLAQWQGTVANDEGPGVDQAGVDAARVAEHLVAVGAREGELFGNFDELVVGPVAFRRVDAALLEDIQVEVHGDGWNPQRPRIRLAAVLNRFEQLREDVRLVLGGQKVVGGCHQTVFDQQRQDVRRQAEGVDGLPALDGLGQLGEAGLVARIASDLDLDVRVSLHEGTHGRVHQDASLVGAGWLIPEHPELQRALVAALADRQVVASC